VSGIEGRSPETRTLITSPKFGLLSSAARRRYRPATH